MSREQQSETTYITIKAAAEKCELLNDLSKVKAEKIAKEEWKNIIFYDTKSKKHTYVGLMEIQLIYPLRK